MMTKAEKRAELNAQMSAFLASGGHVEVVEPQKNGKPSKMSCSGSRGKPVGGSMPKAPGSSMRFI